MLVKLHIQNFTLIHNLDIDFQKGFSVITGETGAGKSILLGALSLVLGKRAEASLLRDTEKKCIIEATFNVIKYPLLKAYFKQVDLDYDTYCLLRRELLPSGKSRAFVNDTPVNLAVLSTIGAYLIDIHSQHQTLDIFDSAYQLQVIDGLAGNKKTLEQYTHQYQVYLQEKAKLEALEAAHKEALRTADYDLFLLEELEKAGLKEGMLAALEAQQMQLDNTAEIIEKLSKGVLILESEPLGVLSQLQELNQHLSKLARFSPIYTSSKARLNEVQIELNDLLEVLKNNAETQEENPLLLEQVNTKLQMLYDLQRKHQVSKISDLIAIKTNLSQKAATVTHGDKTIETQRQLVNGLEKDLAASAKKLHHKRAGVIPSFIEQLSQKLAALGMPKALFKIAITQKQDFNPTGTDRLEFEFSANSGQSFGPLKKVASGGELSRIMLSIKALLSKYVCLPTIIFDEIDTGVSGEVASKIANIMKEMGTELQLISITHLPQVAAKGDSHFKVYKQDDGLKTQTQLTLLTKEERVITLAEMLGGKQLSDSAIAHAKQLLA